MYADANNSEALPSTNYYMWLKRPYKTPLNQDPAKKSYEDATEQKEQTQQRRSLVAADRFDELERTQEQRECHWEDKQLRAEPALEGNQNKRRGFSLNPHIGVLIIRTGLWGLL